ncbi:bifunctional copper resistance protein CopD/cytochrome c oxidase assembly protein [Streptomyces hainanensis]|uniref:Copper resistance protein CopD n=1 Tax=Streptomyces hainanensis TaxID=402648 RepID=A0A4V2Y2Z4_9ACTN|nr:bifunctional copper resistance protein CopD/cytochrome c oxidase assembly protein [Streptomyces hainanensis]TDC74555.1 copper resistance protein CopD [Streptomyces hainanensis]
MAVERMLGRALLRPPVLAVLAGLAAAVALVAAILIGDGRPETVPGLPDAGPVTGWGLPLARTAGNLAAVCTVGALLLVTVLAPGDRRRLGERRLRVMTVAAGSAAAWLAATLATLVFTTSDLLAAPPGGVLDPAVLADVATNLPQGRALLGTALAAGLLATLLPGVTTRGMATAGLLVALVGLVPPAFTGHAASAGDHDAAVLSLAVHIVAATVWIGGLAAVTAAALRAGPPAAVAARRFSRLAGWCLVAVAASGTVNALIRLDAPARLFTTSYGALLLAKTAAIAVLALCGAWHRRRTLPALDAGRRSAFARLAAVELLLMAATVGLAVGLSRSPAPGGAALPYSPARELLGYELPGPLGGFPFAPLFTQWRFDAFFALGVAVAALAYAAGVRTLRARGDAWPIGRTVSWFLGLAVVVLATMSGLATYGKVLFGVHMGQHMVLAMTAPILLVLGAPITLALRALPTASRARSLLTAALHSHYVRVLSHPVVAGALFIGSAFAVYYTPLFGILMRSHWGHLAMLAHFLVVGLLFFWLIIGVDPGPRRPPHFARLVILIVTMPFHSWFSISLMSSNDLIGRGWWEDLGRSWGPSLADDQYAAGAIAWATGDIPVFVTIIALAAQWVRSDFREARRVDRAIDRGGGNDPLAAYNAYLASLHAAAGPARTSETTPDRRREQAG